MSWIAAAGQIFFMLLLAASVGSLYGFVQEAMIIALLGLVVFWQYQMLRVQHWLSDPTRSPPDVTGIWGELTARIYQHQRTNRQVQERLQATVDYLEDSFTSMRDGVVMVDDVGAIKWFNKSVAPLLGLRYPEDTGQTLSNLVRAPAFNEYLLEGEYSQPLQYIAPGDEVVHLRVEITHFGRGERLLFVRDVSAAVRMEQIRRDFVANVSHELRTPLTVLTGYLNTFLDNKQDFADRYTKPLRQMNQQTQRMEDLLSDLLWLSRIESEEREVKRELVDVGSLLQGLKDELNDVHPDRKLVLEATCHKEVQGDYKELYSAASNLVGNAFKYSPAESPVTVSWRSEGEYCVLQVADKGAGIAPVHLPRLTERFYRVDDSRNSTTGGTGLGLAIVKHVAQSHGAQFIVSSELGKGSSFALKFPVGGE